MFYAFSYKLCQARFHADKQHVLDYILFSHYTYVTEMIVSFIYCVYGFNSNITADQVCYMYDLNYGLTGINE